MGSIGAKNVTSSTVRDLSVSPRTTEEQQTYLQQERENSRRFGMWDEKLYKRLPWHKELDQLITAVYSEKDGREVRYSAILNWPDGFDRSISEWGFEDFKYYLDNVLHKNREIEF